MSRSEVISRLAAGITSTAPRSCINNFYLPLIRCGDLPAARRIRRRQVMLPSRGWFWLQAAICEK
jgi:uncharacterized membrane protein YraQ (UPF0718 family)